MRNLTQEAINAAKMNMIQQNPLLASEKYRRSLNPMSKMVVQNTLLLWVEAYEQQFIEEYKQQPPKKPDYVIIDL